MNKSSRKNTPSPEEAKRVVPQPIKDIVSFWLRQGLPLIYMLKLIKAWRNPLDAWKILALTKTGLRVNSIIWNPLYIPDVSNNNTTLAFRNAAAGRWDTYDFTHTSMVNLRKPPSHHFPDADLMFFPIEELIWLSNDIETPEWFFDMFHFDHIIFFTKFSIEKALAYGAIEETTYQKAYEKIGNPVLLSDISELWIGDKMVYQVTPKGSTLILPGKAWGDKTPPLRDGSKEPNREWILQPTY